MNKINEYKSRYYLEMAYNIEKSGYIIFLPGLMGSELCDVSGGNRTVWVGDSICNTVGKLAYDSLKDDGSVDSDGQCILASRTTRAPVNDFYDDYFYKNGEGCFCYDWRESINVEARRLADFVRDYLPSKKDLPGKTYDFARSDKVSFVAHSMGCVLLMRMLGQASDLFSRINQIVFVGPPFWGALSPIQVIEHGTGTDLDLLLPDDKLRNAAATMTGVFNMLPAPPEFWPKTFPGVSAELIHPVRTGDDLYSPGSWTNIKHPEMRHTILQSAYKNYQALSASIPIIVPALRDRIHVFVGLDGKTPQLARKINGDWIIDSVANKPKSSSKSGKKEWLRNGDGRVLTQSSWIESLGIERYYAWIPRGREDTHGSLPNIDEVGRAIQAALRGESSGILAAGLEPLSDVVKQIDWTRDTQNDILYANVYAYNERARLRAKISPADWHDRKLNPLDKTLNIHDSDLFVATRSAALRIINGSDIRREAFRLKVTKEFLQEHVYKLLMPLL